MDVRDLYQVLTRHGPYETLQEADHTLTVLTHRTKLSFFKTRDPFLFDPAPYRFFAVADIRDIALILRDDPPLQSYFEMLPRKYGPSRINAYHILKSLTYFADAEAEPVPRMLVSFDWEECKAFFVRKAHAIVLS